MKLHKREIAFYAMLIFAALVTAVLALTVIGLKRVNQAQMMTEVKGKNYKYHYMLIQTGFGDERSGNLYTGAKKAGEKLGILVEDARESGSQDETTEEMMKTAIAAKVDGIILESEYSMKMQELIDQASEQNIPVAVVGRDFIDSKRKYFVGIDVKQTGEMFGHRVQEMYEGKHLNVAVLTENAKAASQGSVYYHIERAISNSDIDVRPVDVSGENAFSADEKIRALLHNPNEVPDVVVCLNEVETICAYKAAVDYNMVGKIKIIGYSAQEEVISALEKEIIDSTIMIDVAEMGEKAVCKLYDNRDKKNIIIRETVEPRVLDKENISQYRKEKR